MEDPLDITVDGLRETFPNDGVAEFFRRGLDLMAKQDPETILRPEKVTELQTLMELLTCEQPELLESIPFDDAAHIYARTVEKAPDNLKRAFMLELFFETRHRGYMYKLPDCVAQTIPGYDYKGAEEIVSKLQYEYNEYASVAGEKRNTGTLPPWTKEELMQRNAVGAGVLDEDITEVSWLYPYDFVR